VSPEGSFLIFRGVFVIFRIKNSYLRFRTQKKPENCATDCHPRPTTSYQLSSRNNNKQKVMAISILKNCWKVDDNL